jgi:hypothetical protein
VVIGSSNGEAENCSPYGVLLANGITVALAREDRIRENPQ